MPFVKQIIVGNSTLHKEDNVIHPLTEITISTDTNELYTTGVNSFLASNQKLLQSWIMKTWDPTNPDKGGGYKRKQT